MLRSSAPSHLFAEWRSAGALGLLVAFGQGSVAGAQPLAGGVVDLHGDALGGALLGVRVHVRYLAVAQEVLEPVEQLRKLPARQNAKSFSDVSSTWMNCAHKRCRDFQQTHPKKGRTNCTSSALEMTFWLKMTKHRRKFS